MKKDSTWLRGSRRLFETKGQGPTHLNNVKHAKFRFHESNAEVYKRLHNHISAIDAVEHLNHFGLVVLSYLRPSQAFRNVQQTAAAKPSSDPQRTEIIQLQAVQPRCRSRDVALAFCVQETADARQ
jgi:hypothetical protein